MSAALDASSHPSAFDFDLAVLGETATGFQEHLGACRACREHLTELLRQQEDFAASAAPDRAKQRVELRIAEAREARRSRRRFFWAAPALAGAMALALLLMTVRSGDSARLKGGPSLEAFVKSGEMAPRRFGAGERLKASDRVQLAYHAAGFPQITLFVVERGCDASLAGTWRIAEPDGVLPTSWAAEGEGGGRLYLAFSDAPVALQTFVEALRAVPAGCAPDAAPELAAKGFVARGVVVQPESNR